MIALALLGCGGTDRVTVVVTPDQQPIFADFIAFVGDPRLTFETSDDPPSAHVRGVRIAVVDGLDIPQSYAIDGGGQSYVVQGGGIVGEQTGLAQALEALGYRFLHPYDTYVPDRFESPGDLHVADQPEIARRGLHLHTLHPIEALAAMWKPESDVEEARRILDWTVKNGGNHVQWQALNDIESGDRSDWLANETAIADYAHARGMTVGLGVELFGSGNLQQAFDLIDSAGTPEEEAASIDERVARFSDVPWDVAQLSFGEFFGEDPDTFIASVNRAYAGIHAALPDAEVGAVVHVGGSPSQTVTYRGETMQYYFLVKFADPGLVPWIHTVMFYDLFEPANGAYLQDNFDAHRDYLLARLQTGAPVAYYPETAYWVAFDDSLPAFYPVYARSRWADLDGIRTATDAAGGQPLAEHILFSSGWEWGFWLNDRASLRMSYHLRPWDDVVRDAYAPIPGGPTTADAVVALAKAQDDALITGGLGRWLSGRDAVIDFGDTLGIVSQPDRPTIAEIGAMSPADRAAVAAQMTALGDYEAAIDAERTSLPASDDRWIAEVRDGLEVDAARVAFVRANTTAALAIAGGSDPTAALADADRALADGHAIVARRGAALHDPHGARWTASSWDNPTAYDFGYLRFGDELCYWERERAQSANLAGGDEAVPPCF